METIPKKENEVKVYLSLYKTHKILISRLLK
jgi:hypothetical protein